MVSPIKLPPRYAIANANNLDENILILHCTTIDDEADDESADTTTANYDPKQRNKNMMVVRHGTDVILINPVRLNVRGTKFLKKLGNVNRILRLGNSPDAHDEDMYYLSVFETTGMERWAPGEFNNNNPSTLPVHKKICDSSDLPFHCQIFSFQGTVDPEIALLITAGGYDDDDDEYDDSDVFLVTTECLQTQKNNPFVNAAVQKEFREAGLLRADVVISPTWLQTQQQQSASPDMESLLRSDFDRLLELDFDRLVSASGNMPKDLAKDKIRRAVEYCFPKGEGSYYHMLVQQAADGEVR